MKTRKILLYDLLNVSYMTMCHKNVYPSLAGSKTAFSWFLRKKYDDHKFSAFSHLQIAISFEWNKILT